MPLKNAADLWAGLLFAVTGVSFAIGSLNYSFGHAARPGPGYFPFGLGILLAVIGIAVVARGFLARTAEEPVPGRIAWRPLTIIVAAILVFALALPRLGMIVTLPLLIIVISTAGDQFRWRDVLLNCAVLTGGSWLVFSKGLGLTIPVWPAFLN